MKAEHNEQLLLVGLAKGDKSAIEAIYKENFNMVRSLIINNNGNGDDAKDIFQEAMIILYEKARSENFQLVCQIKTYVYSVCKRLWLKRLQQINRYSVEMDNLSETVPVEEEIEAHEKRNDEFVNMDKALNGLGEPCKALLEAYYIEKRNMLEISNTFGYTNADNAKNQKYKCLMRLKKIFFSQYKIADK